MLEIVCVPVIVSIVYSVMAIFRKYIAKDNEKLIRFIPLIGGLLGIIIGITLFYAFPNLIVANNILTAILVGCASGLSATGCDQVFKQLTKYGINVKEDDSDGKTESK